MEIIYGFILIIVIVGLYFIPTIVANYNSKKNFNAIFILNIFLGWTFVFWFIALLWATLKD